MSWRAVGSTAFYFQLASLLTTNTTVLYARSRDAHQRTLPCIYHRVHVHMSTCSRLPYAPLYAKAIYELSPRYITRDTYAVIDAVVAFVNRRRDGDETARGREEIER